MSDTIIIMPTYNEMENIHTILEKIFSLHLGIDVLIVDDSSPDKTYEAVQILIDNNTYNNQLFLCVRKNKEGLGKAYIEGFQYALAKNYKYIMEMDADLSHHPKYLQTFLEQIQHNDLVIGSRYVQGGGSTHWSWFRKLISYGGSVYARTILGIKIQDPTGGFKCFRQDVLKNIDFTKLITTGYAFQIEMNYRASIMGYNVKEIPIIFEDRIAGKSKMSKKIFLEALYKVIILRMHKQDIMDQKHE